MNCIDAIEGMGKSILTKICDASEENVVDMSEFVRSVNSVLEATRSYIAANPEITPAPDVLVAVLYDHARDSWMKMVDKSAARGASEPLDEEARDYMEYCFDYLFTNGTYPL